MNWLAHIALSDPNPAFRVGNVLADLLQITEIRQLPEAFQAGVARHRAIDSFTDKHPVFRHSVARLDPRFRRYGFVVMDIFYDHFLSVRWSEHYTLPLPELVAQFHADIDTCRADIPPNAYTILQRMHAAKWLTSYGDLAGVRLTLKRMSLRLKRPFDLGSATDELQRNYEGLGQDFAEFFPQIRTQFS